MRISRWRHAAPRLPTSPPGGTELAEEDPARLGAFLESLMGVRSHEVLELLARFDGAHPHDEPHYYLSLLGTHPDHRGQGLGMRLLAERLARIDEEHMPCYLESSNPGEQSPVRKARVRGGRPFYPPGGSMR